MSVQHSRQGFFIGAYHPPSQKYEVFDADLSRFPMFVYQLIPGIERIFSTEKFTFVVKTGMREKFESFELTHNLPFGVLLQLGKNVEDNTSKISVIANYIAATSESNPRGNFSV